MISSTLRRAAQEGDPGGGAFRGFSDPSQDPLIVHPPGQINVPGAASQGRLAVPPQDRVQRYCCILQFRVP